MHQLPSRNRLLFRRCSFLTTILFFLFFTNLASFAQEDNDDAETNTQEDFLDRGFPDPRSDTDNAEVALSTPFGQLNWADFKDDISLKEDGSYIEKNGYKIKLTLNPSLQQSLQRELDRQKHISGVVVMMDPKTGALLGMAEKKGEGENPLLKDKALATAARAPAASLIKIVTATAAIEQTDIEPESEIPFFGGCGHLRGKNWLRHPARDKQHLTFAKAFGMSCNTVFARLTIYWTGLHWFRNYADRYFFNKPIPSDLNIETSALLLPETETASALEVGEAGAGFGGSKLSPIHSAMLAAAAGNNGVMMAPYVVEKAWDQTGRLVYNAKPKEVNRVFSEQHVQKIITLMQSTVTNGTSRRYFRRSRLRLETGGKTGTLSDAEDRKTLYTWFNGLAPLGQPDKVAMSVLIASPQNWVVRASQVAQTSLTQYFKIIRDHR